ncbi:MAG: hypothetical protein HY669_03695 [Chloroflexi bacterium]|nr:hypothetical protein [Chloroflexota bacterium]
MQLFEHKVRDIFNACGIAVPRGGVADDAEQAAALAQTLGGAVEIRPIVVPPPGPSLAVPATEAKREAQRLLGSIIVGQAVQRLLVVERPSARWQAYAYVSLDRWEEKPMLLTSLHEVENIYSSKHLEQAGIPYLHFSLGEGLRQFQTRTLAKALGVAGQAINQVGSILWNLHRAWLDCDAEFVAASPLIQTEDSRFLVSGSLSVDEDAAFRHPQLKAEEERSALLTADERQAEQQGSPWVDLDGDIGMFVAGSGMGMAANDVLRLYGGHPANFSDVGGGPSPERVAGAFELLFTNPRVRGVLAFYFGGISRCDDFARGLIMAVEKHRPRLPIVIKLAGTNEKEGHAMLKQAIASDAGLCSCIRFLGGTDTTIDELAQRIVSFDREA